MERTQEQVENEIKILEDAIVMLNQQWAQIEVFDVPETMEEAAYKAVHQAQVDEHIEQMRSQLQELQLELGAIYLSQGTEVVL